MRHFPNAIVVLYSLALFACGGGGGGTPSVDPGPGVDGGKEDPGVAPDVPVPPDVLDAGDPGSDVPEVGQDVDVPPTDAGPDAEVPPVDPGPDSDVVVRCVTDEECEGKVPGLGPCERAVCSEGECGRAVSEDGTDCEDGDPCTENGQCVAGQCVGDPVSCDDEERCTVDTCEPGVGCQHQALTGPCEDGDACTQGDECVAGHCQGEAVDCTDTNPCTEDGCDKVDGCFHTALDGAPCDDGSVCTLDEVCVEGECKGTPLDCDDHNLCTADTCDAVAGCLHAAEEGAQCDDGLECTVGDECTSEGVCGGDPVDCDDGDMCTDDACEEGEGCTHGYNTADCDDLNPCTQGDACHEGLCSGAPKVCDTPPANECLDGTTLKSYAAVGVCDSSSGGCTYESQEATCSAGCEAGACLGDPCEGVDCGDPPGPCFGAGTCESGSCVYPYLDGVGCDDGTPCTRDDACDTGVCVGILVVCNHPPPDECLDAKTLKAWQVGGSCNPASGACEYGFDEVTCAGGCVDGVCIEEVRLLQAELTPGGLLGVESATYGMSCVMPGWSEGGAMASDHWVMSAGFEP